MNVAIGISALLLGGWVLNVTPQKLPQEEADRIPDIQIPFPETAPSANAGAMRKNQNPERALPRDEVQEQERNRKDARGRVSPDNIPGRRTGEKSLTNPQANPQGNAKKQAPWNLPPAPTDPLRANVPGMPPLPLPPTIRESDLMQGPPPVDPYGSPTTPKLVDLPTSRQSYSPRTAQGPSTYEENDQTRSRVDAAVHPGYAPQQAAPKAFADARPYSSGVSPYMNLFRNDTNGGTIDNYSTYVRPALDQRSMNQQFNVDLYGLERNQRIQNAALQQLNRTYSRAPQSIGTPQFYMNYGNYYPGSYGPNNYGQGPNGVGP